MVGLLVDSNRRERRRVIVIGDVSGKGMPAPMTISLLVGTFRTLAHHTQSPSEILRAMNERMIGRNSGGFTTCLIVRIDLAGLITAANAGHLAPYVKGSEPPIENGLPRGIVPDVNYAESQVTLATSDRLTLITDGIVEGRNSAGELFGSERLRPSPINHLRRSLARQAPSAKRTTSRSLPWGLLPAIGFRVRSDNFLSGAENSSPRTKTTRQTERMR